MAKREEDGPKQKMKQDDLIERLVSDPANPEVRSLAGLFLGESNREGFWRLYLTANLNSYREFRKEDTLGAERFPSGRIVVWVKPDTRIHTVSSGSAPIEFLQGDIQRRHLQATGLSGLAAAAPGTGGCGCGRTDPPPNTARTSMHLCCPVTTSDPIDPICGGGGPTFPV